MASQPSESLKRPREPDPGPGPGGSGPEAPADPASKAAAPAEGAGKIDRALKDAALNYLEEVKRKFKHDEKVYNSFLDIMKDFQSRRIKTEGVIDRVSQLFKGDRALILGFNTFLPDGYKIPESYADAQVAAHAKLSAANRARQMAAAQPVSMGGPRKKQAMPMPGGRSVAGAGGLPSTKGPELEYAKRYVQKIKKRFENSEESYQEECKSVKTVYEEVRELFADHRDLLAEFAQFLPAPEAQAQEANAVLMGAPQSQQGKPAKRQRKRDDQGDSGPSSAIKYKDELELMRTLRDNMSRRQWEDLLKVFNLFTQQILSPSEMMEAIQQLTIKHPEMHESLQQFMSMFCGSSAMLAGTAPSAAHAGAAPANTMGEIGPSYQSCTNERGEPVPIPNSLPDDPLSVLNRSCTLRSSPHRLLNHVRKDTGRPGRKEWSNSAENALWGAEDSQLQMDLLVHKASLSVSVLKPLVEETAMLSEEEQKSFNLELGQLEQVISVIELVYGAKADLIVEALHEAPAATLPMVLARFEETEANWCKIRSDLRPKFEEQYSTHSEESLDHQPHLLQVQKLREMELPVLVQGVIGAGARGLQLNYSAPSQDTLLYRLLDAGVDDSQRPQWQLFCQGWLRRFLGSPQVGGLIFVPGLTVGMLRLHHQIHEALHQICAIVEELAPEDQQATLLETLITTMIGTIRRSNSMYELERACKACVGDKFYLFCTVPALVQSLLTHALKLVKSPQWQRVCNIWDSCNSCTSWSISTLTPEQYREMMPSLLGPDCYQVAVTPQRQVTIALCKSNQDKSPPIAAPLQPAALPAAALGAGFQQPAAAPAVPAPAPAAAVPSMLGMTPLVPKQEQLPTLSGPPLSAVPLQEVVDLPAAVLNINTIKPEPVLVEPSSALPVVAPSTSPTGMLLQPSALPVASPPMGTTSPVPEAPPRMPTLAQTLLPAPTIHHDMLAPVPAPPAPPAPVALSTDLAATTVELPFAPI